MSQSIIVDACGWVAVIDSGINIDLELEKNIWHIRINFIKICIK